MSFLIGAGIVINALEDFDFKYIFDDAEKRCGDVKQAIDLIRQAADTITEMQYAIPDQWTGDAAESYISRLGHFESVLTTAANTLGTTYRSMLTSLSTARTQWPKKYSIIPD